MTRERLETGAFEQIAESMLSDKDELSMPVLDESMSEQDSAHALSMRRCSRSC